MAQTIDDQKKPELLSPAGDWASLNAAIDAGADAVYFGIKGLNMRHAAANFHLNEIGRVMECLRQAGVKGYVTLNTVMRQMDLPRLKQILAAARAAQVNAVILWDLAVLALAREQGLRIHLSTQASVANIEALRMYVRQGVSQVVLARECSLDDIAAISGVIRREKIPCKIETFVHGAMCVSVSGRCFLSQETFAKSANQGQCLQPCRREYFIRDRDGECEYVLGPEYLLSPRDLCAIDVVDRLMAAGVDSFKIEGRMRSPEYVRETTLCYRQAIDVAAEGCLTPALAAKLRKRLETVYNRGFSHGFLLGAPGTEGWSRGLAHTRQKVFIGEVTRFFKKISVAEVRLQSHALARGDEILIIGHKTPALRCVVDEMKRDDAFIGRAVKGETIGMKLPWAVRPKDKVFVWSLRHNHGEGS